MREEKAATFPARDSAHGQRAQRLAPASSRLQVPTPFFCFPGIDKEGGRGQLKYGLAYPRRCVIKTGKALTFLKIIKYPVQVENGQQKGDFGLELPATFSPFPFLS